MDCYFYDLNNNNNNIIINNDTFIVCYGILKKFINPVNRGKRKAQSLNKYE